MAGRRIRAGKVVKVPIRKTFRKKKPKQSVSHVFHGNQYVKVSTQNKAKRTLAALRLNSLNVGEIMAKMSEPMSPRAKMIAEMSPAQYKAFKKKLGITD